VPVAAGRCGSGGAPVAATAQHDIVLVDAEGGCLRDGIDYVLEAIVAERLDPAAVVADEVVMMVAARLGRLVPRPAGSKLETMDEPELGQRVERTVNAGDPDGRPLLSNLRVDLRHRQAAVLGCDCVDDRQSRPARPETRLAEKQPRMLAPCHALMIPVLILM
jgi:hypothetical protein